MTDALLLAGQGAITQRTDDPDFIALMEAGLQAALSGDGGDTDYRIRRYFEWLAAQGLGWWQVDLGVYRDHLIEQGLTAATMKAYLSSARQGIRRMLLTRDLLYAMTNPGDPIERRKAFADELESRLRIAASPERSKVRLIKRQDRDDREDVRLTRHQAEALLSAPGQDTLGGLRDTALIAVMLCTGVREGELVALKVDDLYTRLGREPALRVRQGKGMKQRLIPYGDMIWVLEIVEKWMQNAGIETGPVFRGLFKGGKVRETPLTTRAVRAILKSYPIRLFDTVRPVRPHDLRRTYARQMYEAGADLMAIQQNLGHQKQETTQAYIGILDADRRRTRDLYTFPR